MRSLHCSRLGGVSAVMMVMLKLPAVVVVEVIAAGLLE